MMQRRDRAVRLLLAPLLWWMTSGVMLPPSNPQDIIARLLSAHNVERARLGIPPLVWNDKLALQSAKWAQQLTTMDELEHSDTADYDSDDGEGEEGENLWRGTRGYYSPEKMVGLWIDERRIFVNGPFPKNATNGQWRDVGHYTQVIWRSSKQVGCAIAANVQDEILVCRYLEGGNVLSENPY